MHSLPKRFSNYWTADTSPSSGAPDHIVNQNRWTNNHYSNDAPNQNHSRFGRLDRQGSAASNNTSSWRRQVSAISPSRTSFAGRLQNIIPRRHGSSSSNEQFNQSLHNNFGQQFNQGPQPAYHPPSRSTSQQTLAPDWRPGSSLSSSADMDRSRTRRERTFVGGECAVCEEPLEHTLRGERVLQFACTHVSHEACFYEYIKEFDSKYCPTCNAPLGLDTSRGGNVLDLGKSSWTDTLSTARGIID